MQHRRRFIQRMVIMGEKNLTYPQKIIAKGPIAYFPLTELAGDPINYGSGIAALVHHGPTLAQIAAPGGGKAPLYDGTDDYTATAWGDAGFVDPTIGSMMIWSKMTGAGDWTTGAEVEFLSYDTAGLVILGFKKWWNNNKAGVVAGAASDQFACSLLTWFQLALTWSVAANQWIGYLNGIALAAPAAYVSVGVQSELGLGALGGFSLFHHGYLAHCAVWNRVLTPTEILALYNGGL